MTPGQQAAIERAEARLEALARVERGQTNLAEQTGTGVNEGLAALAGAPVDLMTAGINAAYQGLPQKRFDPVSGTFVDDRPQGPLIKSPVGGSETFRKALSPFMTEAEPQTAMQQFGRRFGQEVGSSLPFALGGAALPKIGKAARDNLAGYLGANTAADVGAATGRQLAANVAPNNASVEMTLGLLGGLGAGMPAASLANMRARGKEAADYVAQTPTREALETAASAKYAEGYGLNIKVRPAATKVLRDNLRGIARSRRLMTSKGKLARDDAFRDVMDDLDDIVRGPATTEDMMMLRDALNEMAGSPRKKIAAAGVLMKRRFDDFMDTIAPQFREAHALHTRAMRGEALERADELADIRAAQFTQSGHDNALRAEYAALDRAMAKGTGDLRGLRPDQIEAIQTVSRGNKPINKARGIGRFAPKGAVTAGALGLPAYVGHQIAGLPGALAAGGMAAGVAGAGHMAANAMRRGAADLAGATMRSTLPFQASGAAPGSQGLLAHLLANALTEKEKRERAKR